MLLKLVVCISKHKCVHDTHNLSSHTHSHKIDEKKKMQQTLDYNTGARMETPSVRKWKRENVLNRKLTKGYLNYSVSRLQGSVFASRTVFKNMFDEYAPHYFTIAEAAPHSSTPNNADAQGLAWFSPKFHPIKK